MMAHNRLLVLVGCLIPLAGVAGYFYFAESPTPAEARLAHLRRLEIPEDGLPLFRFLQREIPDVVSQIPCSCCGEMLTACYEGRCPPT